MSLQLSGTRVSLALGDDYRRFNVRILDINRQNGKLDSREKIIRFPIEKLECKLSLENVPADDQVSVEFSKNRYSKLKKGNYIQLHYEFSSLFKNYRNSVLKDIV